MLGITTLVHKVKHGQNLITMIETLNNDDGALRQQGSLELARSTT